MTKITFLMYLENICHCFVTYVTMQVVPIIISGLQAALPF